MKKLISLILLFTLCACSSPKQASPTPSRVVSMMDSLSDIWLLAGGTLLGATDDFDDNIPSIGTVKHPNIEEIIALNPDLVLGSSDLDAHIRAQKALHAAGINCELFDVETFEDYLRVLKRFCDITHRTDLYKQNGEDILRQIDEIKARVPDSSPTFLLIRAMSSSAKTLDSSHMTSVMLRDLGAQNIATPSLLEELSMEEIIKSDPDFILVVPMGDLSAAEQTMAKKLAENPAWSSLSAVKNGRYILLDRDLFHYKPNARWGEAYEKLYKILYN